FAWHDDTFALTERHLQFQTPAAIACLDQVSMLAADELVLERESHASMLAPQCLKESFLQRAFQQAVVRLLGKVADTLQRCTMLQYLCQQLLRHRARDGLAFMAVAVAVHTPIAAVGGVVLVAGAGVQ